ncbi:tyrosine-type recombinase/integrase [Azospirillum sp. RWY-5-1]|uniref:Tyrosine-type recombinase/integrase n=1 Tax=Azospirillum oleiclasticum TaxID=2735135 RepID=A0ABX2T210_9PROT|nr:site-specific integrase [Azospirillum oleiclasticum]NYZ11183.1 tyrosine-type recombinase/integrase [Azospirillum oleiclasticum]NYZ18345.1 tyrosine-type recombinase/integrase [Azospirillum oleiclasticum]
MPALPPTDVQIRALKPDPEKAQTEYRDSRVPGLSLIIGATTRTWSLTYTTAAGQRRRVSLGRYPETGLADARRAAETVRSDARKGADPQAAKRTYRASPTVGDTIDQYLSAYASRKVTCNMDALALRQDVAPILGDRKLVDITRRDVQAVLRRALDRGAPIMANRTLEIVRKMLAWSVDQGWIEVNPAAGIAKPAVEKPRARALTDAELKALWGTLGRISPQSGAAFKLLLLTGQREMEVVGARWSEIDFAAGVWTLPADAPGRSKRGAPHVVPLSESVVDILGALHEATGTTATVFRGKRRGDKGGLPTRSMVANAKVKLDELLPGWPGWRVHDLRRTVRTGLSRINVPPHVAELVIGHAAGGLVKVYDRHDYLAEKREALSRWADHLLRVVGDIDDTETTNVVTLRR